VLSWVNVPADMLITSGWSCSRIQIRRWTSSDSNVAPAVLNGARTITSASGATDRTTPAMKVPWPAYGNRLLGVPWTMAGSGSPVMPAIHGCRAGASGSRPVSTTTTRTPSPPARLPAGPGSGAAPSGTGSGSVAGQYPASPAIDTM
jgi:hypothetical protein